MAGIFEAAERDGLIVTLDLGKIGSQAYQTGAVAALAERHPELTIVIAHLAQPPIGDGEDDNAEFDDKWREQILLGRRANVFFDLSALPAYSPDFDEYPYAAARRYIKRAVDLIGAEKIMWGTDAPGLLTSGSYRQLLNYVRLHCDFLSEAELADVLGLNALRVYWRGGKANTMTEATNQEQDRASQGVYTEMRNSAERLEWYQDMALGMYLYWTVDAPFGMVNAHSVIGASSDYLRRYFSQLPGFFNPRQFDARLVRAAGEALRLRLCHGRGEES